SMCGLEPFPFRLNRNGALDSCFDAPSSREPVSTSLENALVDRADQVLDLLGVGPKLLGKLVEVGIGDRGKALLVHILDDLDAETLQLGGRSLLKFEGPGGLLAADVRCRRGDPALLLVVQALPQLVA